MRDVKRAYTVDDVADRATRVIHWLVGHGVTFIRSYVNVDSIVGSRRWRACSPRASAAAASPTSS